ncbi:MAG: hypothetical protein IT167_03590 [Bryobacterales bacterium]|nr:hypothetical protein [Bryobacterales bacterium]
MPSRRIALQSPAGAALVSGNLRARHTPGDEPNPFFLWTAGRRFAAAFAANGNTRFRVSGLDRPAGEA